MLEQIAQMPELFSRLIQIIGYRAYTHQTANPHILQHLEFIALQQSLQLLFIETVLGFLV